MATKRTLKRRKSPSSVTVNKAASKAIKKTGRDLKKAAAAGRRQAEQNELAYIERILGEDFESLSQARRELKKNITTNKSAITRLENQLNKSINKTLKKTLPKQLKKLNPTRAKKSVLKTVQDAVTETTSRVINAFDKSKRPYKQSQPHIDVTPSRKIYTIEELKDGDKRAIRTYLADRLNANALTRELLKPGEAIVAQVSYTYKDHKTGKVKTGYANTYEVYESFAALFLKLSEYGSKSLKSLNKTAEWLKQIKIMKWNETSSSNPAKKNARNNATSTVKKGRR